MQSLQYLLLCLNHSSCTRRTRSFASCLCLSLKLKLAPIAFWHKARVQQLRVLLCFRMSGPACLYYYTPTRQTSFKLVAIPLPLLVPRCRFYAMKISCFSLHAKCLLHAAQSTDKQRCAQLNRAGSVMLVE